MALARLLRFMPPTTLSLSAEKARLLLPTPRSCTNCPSPRNRAWGTAVRSAVLRQNLFRAVTLAWHRSCSEASCLPPRRRCKSVPSMQTSGGTAIQPSAKRQKTAEVEVTRDHQQTSDDSPAPVAQTQSPLSNSTHQQTSSQLQTHTQQQQSPNRQQSSQHPSRQQQPQQQQQQQPKAKKQKVITPEHQLLIDVQTAAKTRNPAAGVAAYNQALAAGISVNPQLYSVLLYLCSGGDEWEQPLRRQLVGTTPLVEDIMQRAAADAAAATAATAAAEGSAVSNSSNGSPATAVATSAQPNNSAAAGQGPGSPSASAGNGNGTDIATGSTAAGGAANRACGSDEAAASTPSMSAAQLHEAGRSIFEDMQKQRAKPLELAYTALARMAATAGDGDAALEATNRGLSAGVPPRLRGFVPALLAYAVAGEADKALQVADSIQEQKLDLTESEFALLLHACAVGNASWQSVQGLLSRMTKELTRLQPETLAAAEQYFRSDAAKAAAQQGIGGKGRGRWVLEPCTVSETGQTSNCGGQLQALDLEEEEWEQFASGIAQLAAQRERKPKDFQAFQAWLEQHGPVQALVDGANVALYGQNWERGAFSFGQVKGVLDQLGRQHPDLRPLMMLHVGRTKGPAAECKTGKSLLTDLKKRHALYATPPGSNDDWYWMYAAVKAGPKGMLISNDEMRDHMFQLLAPRFFHKWKQRHQVKFTFDEAGLHLHYPPVYTVCAQGLANGSFVFPAAQGNVWLSARLQSAD